MTTDGNAPGKGGRAPGDIGIATSEVSEPCHDGAGGSDSPRVHTLGSHQGVAGDATAGPRVTWLGPTSARDAGTFLVAFGPTGDALAGAKTRLAIARTLAPGAMDAFMEWVFLPTVVFTLVLAAVTLGCRRLTPDRSRRPSSAIPGTIGGTIVATLLVFHPVFASYFGRLLLLAGGFAAVMYTTVGLADRWEGTRRLLREPRGQAKLAAVAVGVTGVALALSIGVLSGTPRPTAVFGRALKITVPVALIFPLGGAVATGGWRRVLGWTVATVAGFTVALSSFIDLLNPAHGALAVLLLLILMAGAVVLTAIGTPLTLLGSTVAGHE